MMTVMVCAERPGQPGDFRLRQLPVATDQRQHQPLIIEADAALVGSPRGIERSLARRLAEGFSANAGRLLVAHALGRGTIDRR
jgi:hypothetical protein